TPYRLHKALAGHGSVNSRVAGRLQRARSVHSQFRTPERRGRKQIMTLHPRLLFGVVVGILSFWLLWTLGASLQTATLGGWNLGAVTYLCAIWRLYLTSGEAEVRDRAARYDEPSFVILMLASAAILVSLAGVYF